MRDIVIEVFNSDSTNMARVIRGAVSLEVIMHFPRCGKVEMRQDCSHYHIKQGDGINIYVKGKSMTNPAVVKNIRGNVIYFEERMLENKWVK
ncbi:hypothetical protein EFS28_07410 [Lactobacillus acidophilus]|uniref:hypothetical protein n=1 Tax=Lactobacillus acidophilus TaxID=1579 RepID=UPI0021A95634|nr:hypothetical protein [Lactobacillus acidophilus]MCT3603129.1 hypothetical protein [Lactobacillus acidophilus]MCT3624038.1 hypothetical protein [Lactobacillus acidophilus]